MVATRGPSEKTTGNELKVSAADRIECVSAATECERIRRVRLLRGPLHSHHCRMTRRLCPADHMGSHHDYKRRVILLQIPAGQIVQPGNLADSRRSADSK